MRTLAERTGNYRKLEEHMHVSRTFPAALLAASVIAF
jgi:hypothetical protein